MKFHPITSAYPAFSDRQFAELCQDIKEHGLRVPIVLWNDQIIDGRHRYKACKQEGVEPDYQVWAGDEADMPAYVESLNSHRRHLTLEELEERRQQRVARVAEKRADGKSLRTIAEEEGVSESQVRQDLEKATAQGCAVKPPDGKVKGRDGRTTTPKPHAGAATAQKAQERLARQNGAVFGNGQASTLPGGKVEPLEPEEESPAGDVDDLGIPVQEHAAAAFAVRPLFDELMSKLRECRRLYARLAEHPGGAYLLRPGISLNSRDSWKHKGIETAILNLADCRPAITVCPRAYHLEAFPDCQDRTPHGDDCNLCHGLNWSRPLAKGEVAPEVIAKVKEAFGVEG